MRTLDEFADEALQHANYIGDTDERYKTQAWVKVALAFLVVMSEYLRRRNETTR